MTAKVGVINADGSAIESKTVEVKEDVENVPAELEEVLGSGKTIGEAKNYVAMIGTAGYESLADAVAAAQDGATIKLAADMGTPEAGYVIGEGKNIIIDLNGKTVAGSVTDAVFLVEKNGKLTINGDGKVVANWAYYKEGSASAMAVWATGSAQVTINGGDYENTITQETGDPNHYDLIYASGSAEITVNGGTYKNATPKWTLNCKDHKEGQSATITVNGGSFYNFDPSNAEVGTDEIIIGTGYAVSSTTDGWYTVAAE